MSKKKNSTTTMRVVCAIAFLLFTFFYLYDYQADLLTMAQHVLSGGKTVYDRNLGAILITIVLSLVSFGVYVFTGLTRRNHALIYFPALLLLTILTDVDEHLDEGFTFGVWLFLFPLLLILYRGLIWMIMKYKPYESDVNDKGFFSRVMWENIMLMFIMFVGVILTCNHNDVFHYRMKMEVLMNEGKYKEATLVGKKAAVTDSSLTFLRIKALDLSNGLGEHLFEYPLMGGSKATRENGRGVKAMLWKDPKYHWHRIHYVKGRPDSKQLILCRYLLDKNLDGFVENIGKYYKIDSTNVPKHFREALTLYTHLRSNPKIIYHSSVMDTDFQDYQVMEHKYSKKTERQDALYETYGNTYWYYYQYNNSKK